MKHPYVTRVPLQLFVVDSKPSRIRSVPKSRQGRLSRTLGLRRSALKPTLHDVKAGLCPSGLALAGGILRAKCACPASKAPLKSELVARNASFASRSTVSQR